MNAKEFQEKYGYAARDPDTKADYEATLERQKKYIENHGHGSRTYQTLIDTYEVFYPKTE